MAYSRNIMIILKKYTTSKETDVSENRHTIHVIKTNQPDILFTYYRRNITQIEHSVACWLL